MFFTSDNAAGVHPQILAAVGRAAEGPAAAYGGDPLTAAVEARVREVFEAPQARAFLVATGTAANSLSLACLCPPWATVYTQEGSHIETDECAAPEFYTGGAKLTLIGGADAKIDAGALAERIRTAMPHDLHNVQHGAVSLTQATELGAVYTLDETRRLTGIARDAGMAVHMDGTRFANAVARLGCTPAEASWKAGVDILCLGATKNGAMAAEAVILFDPSRSREFELRRKRGGHLFSKMRFVAAQMDAYLTDGLWLGMAAHANAMADRLAAGLRAAPGCRVLNAIGANIVFAEMPLGLHRRLQAAGARYYPSEGGQDEAGLDDAPFRVRLVCSFQTSEAEVNRFIGFAAGR
ncbi:MAG TPA: beta-eliminating lyase-related protein [Thermohalobaculum sp.]|nr:beta-eliminating lyase-related protein [Thermohalobaculum sp.]